ncbi:MAG TPA: NAD(P)-binding protein, partial [Burkholderiaceae bacterium]
MDETPRGSASDPWAAVIIGAGFGGLGMAIALRRAGEDGVLLLEKGCDVGGVWR